MMNYRDSLEMMVCFIFELLRSISVDFDERDVLQERRDLAMKMTKIAIKDFKKLQRFNRQNNLFIVHRDKVMKLKTLLKTISSFKVGHQDGRIFREEFPYGYINMLEYFEIEKE